MTPTKLPHHFYLRPALTCATDFLGKILVHSTPAGRISGIIYDVEAYPAFHDQVHHGNKKTPKVEVLWGTGGHAYVYVIYGIWHQFSAVVNIENIPDVVFIRSIIPLEGIHLMQQNWPAPRDPAKLADTPGKLCKSFGITKAHNGIDLTSNELFIEDHSIHVPIDKIQVLPRVGISSSHSGFDLPLRFHLDPNYLVKLTNHSSIEYFV